MTHSPLEAFYGDILSALNALSVGAPAPGPLPDLAAELSARERLHLFRPDYVYPIHYWGELDEQQGYPVRDRLKQLGDPVDELATPGATALAGLIWRFSALSQALQTRLFALAAAEPAAGFAHLPVLFQFELLNFLSFYHRWDLVARLAKISGAAVCADDPLRPFLADTLYLASFHRFKRYGDRSKPAPNTPSLRDAARLATGIAGEDSQNALVYEGTTLSLEGDMQSAERVLAKVAARQGRLKNILAGARTVVAPELIATAVDKARSGQPRPALAGSGMISGWRHNGAGRPAFYIASDAGYFEHFGRAFLDSVAVSNPGALVHIHLVNFDLAANTLDLLEAETGLSLNLSREEVTGLDSVEALAGYIVTARYYHLADLLPHYGALFLSDIDGVVFRAFADYPQLDGPAVVMATQIELASATSCNPLWGSVSGGVLALKQCPEHQLFVDAMAHDMARRIAHARAANEGLFFADQTALAQFYLALRRDMAFARMRGTFFLQAPDSPGTRTERILKKADWQYRSVEKLRRGERI